MTGWVLNIPVLRQVVPGFVQMVFNAALCFVIFSCALLITQYHTGKYGGTIFLILSLLGTLIGLVTWSQFVLHYNTGLDQLFISDQRKTTANIPFAGRMAYNAAIGYTILGLGFVLLSVKKRWADLTAQYLFHLVTVVSAIILIGYLYRVSLFNSFLDMSSMATHTAVLFLILSLTASLLHPSLGMPRIFMGSQIGNRFARRLFALMLVTVFILGSLRMQANRFNTMPLSIWVSLVTVCILLAIMLIIWNMAAWLNGIDARRSKAEAEVKLINRELEKLVERRTAEIQRSEEKYRSLIEQASDAIYVLDLQMNFTEVNASMCEMIGYSKDELLGMNVRDIIDPEELKTDPLLTVIERPDEAIFRERRFMRKDGTIFTVEVNVKIFSGERVMVIARDITGRKRIENELKEAELKFRTLAEKSMVGVYITQGDKFKYVNPRFAEIFGYLPVELIDAPGNAVEILISDDYQKIVWEYVQARYRGDMDNIHYEVKGKKKDGSTNWVEFYGSRVIIHGEPSIIGTMLDITERKEA
ncbi:MAG TPA: PAS domain S-box protein, partial [Mucilaginibacter sp.]|nr:PAS domain S-box protein [Mucilaginibacter sp.]